MTNRARLCCLASIAAFFSGGGGASAADAPSHVDATARPAVPALAPTDPMPPKVGPSAIKTTLGTVRTLRSGRLQITEPKVRFVVPATHDDAALAFRYIGPTEKTAALASGAIRRQLGVKLRAANGCNVVYAMWRFEPKNEVVVSVKRNDGKTIHAQCGANGYKDIAPMVAHAPPAPLPNQSHVLRAKLTGDRLRVTIDDKPVWEGALPREAFAFDGPAGARTDNVKIELDYHARPRPAGSHPFTVVPGDD
jgi:hypothetical protein